MLPSHSRAKGSLPIPRMGCLWYRCSVSLWNAVEPLLVPLPSQLLLCAGWVPFSSLPLLVCLGGWVSCVAYRAQLGRLGGSGVGFFK